MYKSNTNNNILEETSNASSYMKRKEKLKYNLIKAVLNMKLDVRNVKNDTTACAVNTKDCIWRRVGFTENLLSFDENYQTINDILNNIYKSGDSRKILGSRKLISNINITDLESGLQIPHYKLENNFTWINVKQFKIKIFKLAYFLSILGVKKGTKIALFTETQADWLIMAFAAITIGARIVTIYSILPDYSLYFILNITKVKYLFTNTNGYTRLSNMDKRVHLPKTIILSGNDRDISETDQFNINDNLIFENLTDYKKENNYFYTKKERNSTNKSKTENDAYISSTDIDIHKHFPSFEEQNKENNGRIYTLEFITNKISDLINIDDIQASNNADDVAIIVFTSGSSGFPKGVMIQHGSIINVIASLVKNQKYWENLTFAAFLPQSHIFELIMELIILSRNGCIGYCNPLTLITGSQTLAPDVLGDLTCLKPSMIIFVPLIVEKIKSLIENKSLNSGSLSQALFNLGYEKSINARDKGKNASFISDLIFKKVKKLLGGCIKFAVIGGAPLAKESEEFLNVCFGAPMKQGYGLTETTGPITFSTIYDISLGNVGPPLACNQIKLVDWVKGGYTTQDKPNPRGEIHVSGYNLFLGYYKNKKLTDKTCYYDSESNTKWCKTGDIAEVLPDGKFIIIDRKNDIVKLKDTDYISLSQIENNILRSEYVESCCVIPDKNFNYLGVIIVANKKSVRKIADINGIPYTKIDNLLKDKIVTNKIIDNVQKIFKSLSYQENTVPTNFYICFDQWTSENGLLTSTNKPRRREIAKRYNDINYIQYKSRNIIN